MKDTRPGFRKRMALGVFARYRRVQAALHDLNYLFWECTLRCNLGCRHCGSDCHRDSQIQDMPLADILRVLDEVRTQYRPEKVMLALTGGEPLLRDDIDACGAAFTERGFPWGMVSNGYHLSAERFEALRRAGLRSLTISLDGLEGSHTWLRGRPDSYARALEAITIAARAEDMAFDVVTCVNQRNFDELAALRDLLASRGVRQWRLFTIFPKGRAEDDVLLDLSGPQLEALLEFIRATRNAGIIKASYGCEGFLGPFEGEVRDGFFWCRAGVHIGSVLADGSISACPSLRGDYIQGNIHTDSFLDCWNHRFANMRDRAWARTGECVDCPSWAWCEGNGLHLRDEQTGGLLRCHMAMLEETAPDHKKG